MRLHCSINVWWYVVTKGKILSLAFFFCVKADALEAKLKPEGDLIVLDSRVFGGVA